MTAAPAFALLHGGGQGSWVWGPTVRALEAKGARVMALDVPGCGVKRGRDLADMTVDHVAAELLADLAGWTEEPVTLVGHSLGGVVLTRMAETAPDRFARLIYVSCAAPLPGQTPIAMIGGGVQGASDSEVGWPVDPATHTPEQRYRAMFCNDMAADAGDDFLARLGPDVWPTDAFTRSDWRYDHLAPMPVSYVVFERDAALPPLWQERFAARVHANRVARVDAGHQAMWTRPDALADVLLAEAG